MSKGDDLEAAAAAIERAILAAWNYGPHQTRVETKKTFVANGVKHEIDVFVTVFGSDQHAYIFECKNWSDSVGKNEVIIFAEKIRVSGARAGFMIAPSFGKYAEAQAALYDDLHLLTSTSDFDSIGRFPEYYFVERLIDTPRCKVEFICPTLLSLNVGVARVKHRGRPISMEKLTEKLLGPVVEERFLAIPAHDLSSGERSYVGEKLVLFPRGELYFNGHAVESARVNAHFTVRVERPIVQWKYEVAPRGRAIHFLSHFQQAQIGVTFSNVGYAEVDAL